MTNLLDDNFIPQSAFNDRKWTVTFLILLIIGAIIATVVAWMDVETIVASGPTLSVLGWLLLWFARKSPQPISRLLCWTPFLISLFWLSMIVSLDLEPRNCAIIVPASLTVVCLLMLLSGINWYVSLEN